jgi:hypothetical protein
MIIGNKVKVIRDLMAEELGKKGEWIGSEGKLVNFNGEFYVVAFTIDQIPSHITVKNNEAWFSDVELEVFIKKQQIKPNVDCPHCHGWGTVYDTVDYGSTTAQLPSFCGCVEDQTDDDTDEIELVFDPIKEGVEEDFERGE